MMLRLPSRWNGRLGDVRIHRDLEEDAAKLVHDSAQPGESTAPEPRWSTSTRGGTPLVEIVTQPRAARDLTAARGSDWSPRTTIRQIGVWT